MIRRLGSLKGHDGAYNVFNEISWENADLSLSSPNVGQVTRKRTDSQGRELQIGIRVVF